MVIFHRLVIAFLLFVFLVGCSTTSSTNEPPLVPQSSQPAPNASGLISSPSITARPAFSETPSQTQTVFDEAIYYATQSVVQTKVAQFPRVCKENHSRPNFSPNDFWMVEGCYSESDHDLVLTLSNRQTQVLWKLLYRDYIPHTEFADGGILVVHWSKDGRYAYFTSFLGGDGGECFFDRFDTGSGLFRLDLQTGQTKAILPLNDNLIWYSFSISPTDKRLVYGVRSMDLKVLNITTGRLIEVAHEKNFSQGSGYIWSSDGLKFVYSTVTDKPDHVGREGYSLRLVDAQTGSERIILESPEDCFVTMSWTEDSILTIERYDKNYDRTLIEFDLSSNKIISEATVTP